MTRLALSLVLMLVASIAQADKIVVPLSATEGLLIQSTGPVTVERIPIQSIGVVPVTPTDPVPPIVTGDRVKRFRDAATAVNEPETAKNLMALYTGMAQRTRPPNPLYTTPQQLESNIREATEIFLIDSAKKIQWNGFRDTLTDEWVKVAQGGGGMEDYAKILDDAATGLGISSNSEGEAFDVGAILKILQILGDPNLTRIQKIIAILPLILTLFP